MAAAATAAASSSFAVLVVLVVLAVIPVVILVIRDVQQEGRPRTVPKVRNQVSCENSPCFRDFPCNVRTVILLRLTVRRFGFLVCTLFTISFSVFSFIVFLPRLSLHLLIIMAIVSS